ncbi:sigma-70 family RNA polymerase sigma factor [Streptomyces flavochromogenes]|uniref:sigma-70 family RNA polymerase sigma factor n=1 Tax=Streptomyces flavochromogenes TaxID=68199 RepID=UPI0004C1386E|nr:sigma-70 family RNA polymerase sigma factor [Streptomyces flavochromogenes]
MHSDERRTTALVEAARAGDAHARDALVRAYLPLVHNIVGRALDGHADTDDIVQETMVRALDGLTGLRDPARFRSWLVAIAMNGIRRRWRERQQAAVPGLDRAADLADPAAGDFTEVTILRLGLSGQRRDVARATRWLDEDDRELLALWWLEAAGELTRAELAEGLGGISPQHAAVRVQRMKERLETGRAVVRALDAMPGCPDLAETVTAWDGRPSPLWRKRIARHVRTCAACTARVTGRSGLAPVEGLLVGLGLVPPLVIGLTDGPAAESVAFDTLASGTTVPDAAFPDVTLPGPAAPDAAVSHTPASEGIAPDPAVSDSVSRWTPLRRAGAAGAAAVAVLGAVALLVPQDPHVRMAPGSPVAAPPAPPAPTTPPATPTPTRTAAPTPTATPPTPRRTPRPTPAPTREERVTGLVNRLRAEAGCAPLRIDPRLTEAARGYARDMAARGYFGHASPEGEFADSRITAAGYAWGAWAENLDRGTADPASVVDDWTDGSMHEENMLDCRYRDTGVASAPGPGGTIWVQKLAAPAS